MTAPGSRKAASRTTERLLPLSYLLMAMLVVALALPSALRPPPERANQSAELSPDAPPDNTQDSIVSALNRGTSATAGAPAGERGAAAGPVAGVPGVGPPPSGTTLAPRACPYGFGDPPRQTFSLYAAPCATPWAGDNGGSTWKGVTGSEFRIAIIECASNYHTTYEGPTPLTAQPNESAADRTWRAYQAYFNSRYEFYGRRLRFVQIDPQPCSDTDFVNAVVMADEDYQAFAISSPFGAATDEAQRRGMLATGLVGNAESWFASHQPSFAFDMSGSQLTQLTSELICKQLAGRPVTFTDDPALRGRERVFGAFLLTDRNTAVSGARGPDDIQRPLNQACGVSWKEIVPYDPYVGSDLAQYLASAMTRMRANGVTTLACFCDPFFAIPIIDSATQQAYFPEWLMPGAGSMDRNDLAWYYDSSQWRHALGITALEIPRPWETQDCYRAYKEMEPTTEPQRAYLSICTTQFKRLSQFANGVQLAGPKLTPTAVVEGLFRMPRRLPDPEWTIGGYFAPGHYAYADYISLVWWDPSQTDPEWGRGGGAYRFLLNGKRFRPGEIPDEPLPWSQSGITRAPGF